MKKKIIISAVIIFLSIAAFMSSCRWNQSEIYLRSMVSAYGVPKKLLLNTISDEIISVKMKISNSIVFYNSAGEDKVVYDNWCQKHGDMSYNREVRNLMGDHLPHEFVAADYTAIEVVSDMGWDAKHPGGASLVDITMFYSASPIKYIQSGYSKKYNWNGTVMPEYFYSHMINYPLSYPDGIAKGKTSFYPVMKLVSELKPEDMILLGSGYMEHYDGRFDGHATIGFLEFTTRPTENKTHNITVTLTTDEGETFSDTINMTFE